ncbi:hypothetical protein, conserved [Eimeria tenella]|uniref:Uncharacterized protein n=1 Tax=Eimeria tenella TaxID=5802 RepID=U6L214_EIMTE|nr:hypothetical protein, conserved [Eimeria tenella]CDJ41815.1 hypothetical protein, conserved [Eimeria tenella]|eukprot:XP_013232565.1 hypothetical protein, conserved [Eimeria tenella]
MPQGTQGTGGASWGSSSLSCRTAALLAAARHGPFALQAKKAVKTLEAPSAHVRCSGLHKLKSLLLKFSHLHKERQVALELLLLALEHGTLSVAESEGENAAAMAVAFNKEHQLPCAAFLQPPAAAAAVQPAAAAAAAAAEEQLRSACRSEALICLTDLIADGAIAPQQLIDLLHARLAAAETNRTALTIHNRNIGGRNRASREELLPPQMQLLLVQRFLKLALQDKLVPASHQEDQQQLLVRLQQAAAVLRDALIRISHFCPRVCLAAVEAVSCVLEEAAERSSGNGDESSSNSGRALQSVPFITFTTLLEPTLLTSLQLLLSCSSSSLTTCSLLPLAVNRLLRCVEVVGKAEMQETAKQQHAQQQQRQAGQQNQSMASDRLLHLSLSALMRVTDAEEFSCCLSAALRSAEMSSTMIAAFQSESKVSGTGEWLMLQQQQQARADRLLWECVCGLYTAREQLQDVTALLRQLLRCLNLFSPSRTPISAASSGGSSGDSNSSHYSRTCLSLGLWRVTCALVGWLLWSTAANEANSEELSLLLQATHRMLQLQPQFVRAHDGSSESSTTRRTSGCCASCLCTAEALRCICCFSPLVQLLVPLVTQQQLGGGAGGALLRQQLIDALQQTCTRLRALLSCAAAAAAAAAVAATGTPAAEEEHCNCSGACGPSFDVTELFGLAGAVLLSSDAAAAMPLSLALWSFRVLDRGAAEQLLGAEVFAATTRPHLKNKLQLEVAQATAGSQAGATAGQRQLLLHMMLDREYSEDIHSTPFLLSLPSALLQQGPYTYVLACCFLAESLADRQQAFATIGALVAASPAAALQLLPALHFAALRLPTSPIVRTLLRWKIQGKHGPREQQPRRSPLLPDEFILFDGHAEFAAEALAAAGAALLAPSAAELPSVTAERRQLLESLSKMFALSLQALASLGLHKTAVLPVYRALFDLLPVQKQQTQKIHEETMQGHRPLSSDQWLCKSTNILGPSGKHDKICCFSSRKALNNAAAVIPCIRCCCCSFCCWCSSDPLGELASCMEVVPSHRLLSTNGMWFLLMRSLSRLAAYDELPYSKLTAAVPAAEAEQSQGDTREHQQPVVSQGKAGGEAVVVHDTDAAVFVPFILPQDATPLQQLLLAFCLQQLEAVCPRALLQFLPAMEQLVASYGVGPPQLQQRGASQQQLQWLLGRACGVTLCTLGRLCMRRFLETPKIMRVLRRKCQFLFNTLQAPRAALEGFVLILFALSQDLAEQIEHHQQHEDERVQQLQQHKPTESGLPQELESQLQQQLLLLEEVAEAGSPFARSVALQAASLILGPLYVASAEAASGGILRTPAGEGASVRFACSEGLGGVVLHLPLRQLEIRGAASLLAAAMSKERIARGGVGNQTPAELLRQQQQHKLGTLLSRRASVDASDTSGYAHSERALLRLLLFSSPRPSGGSGCKTSEGRDLKELRAYTHFEIRDIARHLMTTEPLLLCLLPRVCEFFVQRFAAMLPPALAADGELLQLGHHLLQELELLLPRAAVEEQQAVDSRVTQPKGTPAASPLCTNHSAGFGLRLSEFSVLASLISALTAQQPALIPAIFSFFSQRLNSSAAAPPPPWLSSCLLLALAPVHATSADVSELWTEFPEGEDGAEVFSSLLQGFRGQTGAQPSATEIQQCLCGTGTEAGNDLRCAARCIFLAAHAQLHSGDPVLLSSCLRALMAAVGIFTGPSSSSESSTPASSVDGKSVVVTAALAVAIGEVSRVTHLQTPDPTYFYAQLLELYKVLERLALSCAGPQSSQWNALLALGSLLPIVVEAGVLPLDEALYFMQRLEEFLGQALPDPSTLAFAGLAHLTQSLLPLLLLLQRPRQKRSGRTQQQVTELQRLLLHFEDVVLRALATPAVGAVSQLSRAFTAAALIGAPFVLQPPTHAAAAQRSAGASSLTWPSFALCGPDMSQGNTTNQHPQEWQQQMRHQQGKQQDAFGAALDRLINWLSGNSANASVVSFGNAHAAQPARGQKNRYPDLAGSMVLSLLYMQLTSHTAEGSLASLPEKSLTRLALQHLLQIREGQELLFPEGISSSGACLLDTVSGTSAPGSAAAVVDFSAFQELSELQRHEEAAVNDVAEAFGWIGLLGSRGCQREASGANGLPVPHCTCLLEALSYRGIPAFSELQLSRRLALLFSRSLEATVASLAELAASKGGGLRQQPTAGASPDNAKTESHSRLHQLLRQLQSCSSLQLGVLRFCCRHCDRLPQLAALFVRFAYAGFGVAAASAQCQQQQQHCHSQRRFTSAMACYFFALLPVAAGSLSPRDVTSLVGSVLLRGLMPPSREPFLWCSALNALRRIFQSARRSVCCSGRETQQRKRWELQQQQRQQKRRRFSLVESETPLYVFPSVSYKLCFFRELQKLMLLWVIPLLTNTAVMNSSQRPAASSEATPQRYYAEGLAESQSATLVAAAAAARAVPFAVWGTAAEALVAFLELRKDCQLVQDALNGEDVASLPTAELRSRRRQHFELQKEEEFRQLRRQLCLLPAHVVVYLVISGAAPLEILHEKRKLLLNEDEKFGENRFVFPVEQDNATGAGVPPCRQLSGAEEADIEPLRSEDHLATEVAAFCHACSWLPIKDQLEFLEAFACSSSSSKASDGVTVSAVRCFLGLVTLAAHMVAPHSAAFVLPNVAGAKSFLTAGRKFCGSGHVAHCPVGVAAQSDCAYVLLRNSGVSELSLCGEFAAFPSACYDVAEREDSLFTPVAETRLMYTSQHGIKHLLLLHHQWLCSTARGTAFQQRCCCSLSCFSGKRQLLQLVAGAAGGMTSAAGQCLEPLLLIPAAFSGARGFYCLNFAPNIYYLSSLVSQPFQQTSGLPTPGKPSSAHTESRTAGQCKVDASALCSDLAAQCDAAERWQKKAMYGEECHEEILLERRDAVLVQAHFPSSLMVQATSYSNGIKGQGRTESDGKATAEKLLAAAEALAPTVVRLLYEEARRRGKVPLADNSQTIDSGNSTNSVAERIRLLAVRLQRLLGEIQSAGGTRACTSH